MMVILEKIDNASSFQFLYIKININKLFFFFVKKLNILKQFTK